MLEIQTFNQLYFAIIGLMLMSLFASTIKVGLDPDSGFTGRLWLLSVGTRALCLFMMAATPVIGAPSAMTANALFLFSAGCLALLFRSLRMSVHRTALFSVGMYSALAAIAVEIIRQNNPDFQLRVLVLGTASLLMSVWEMVELRQKVKLDRHPLIRALGAIVVFQVLLSIASVVTTFIYAKANMSYMADNGTKSLPIVWFTISIHVIVYFFIGGYLYLKAAAAKRIALEEKEAIAALLTERERLLSTLIVSNRIASTGAFSAAVAHEISQPITAAMLQSNLLKRTASERFGEDSAFVELIHHVHDNLHRSKDLLENLRSIFRQLPTELEPCNLNELVSQTISLMQSRLAEASVQIDVCFDHAVRASIVKHEVQQVLINLINNAIDAVDNLEVTTKRIKIELVSLEQAVRIAVTDNGSGVPAELTDSLFELASTGKANSKGSGIGLWLAKHIIEERHKGKIYVDARHVPGARFVVELPS